MGCKTALYCSLEILMDTCACFVMTIVNAFSRLSQPNNQCYQNAIILHRQNHQLAPSFLFFIFGILIKNGDFSNSLKRWNTTAPTAPNLMSSANLHEFLDRTLKIISRPKKVGDHEKFSCVKAMGKN